MFSSACGLRGYLLLAGGLLAAVISCARVDGSVPAAADGSPPPTPPPTERARCPTAQADRGPPKPGCVNLQCQLADATLLGRCDAAGRDAGPD